MTTTRENWDDGLALSDPEDPRNRQADRERMESEEREVDSPVKRARGQKAHRETAGELCPACGKDNIEGSWIETGRGQASQEMTCRSCGAGWNDVYDLAGYEFLQDEEEREIPEPDPPAPQYACPNCGATENLQALDWLDLNTGELVGGNDDPGEGGHYCGKCEDSFKHPLFLTDKLDLARWNELLKQRARS